MEKDTVLCIEKDDEVKAQEQKIGLNENHVLKVCFVCTGNTCRSPMAEAVLNYLGNGKYLASSAGLNANEGDKISENAVKALQKAEIRPVVYDDYREHKSRQITEEIVKKSDKIVAISERHMLSLLEMFPKYEEKIICMPCNVPDPFMQGEKVYECTLEMICECIKELFAL